MADTELEAMRKAKDGAYAERQQCVALMARMARSLGWRVWVARHPDLDTAWEDDWRTILFIQLPTGQVSWHFHDSERHLLRGLLKYGHGQPNGWDGHDTPEKYRRVNAALQPPGVEPTPILPRDPPVDPFDMGGAA